MITGARALVDCLLREGVDHVFGIPGTQNLPIIDALRETPEIRFILTRHEQAAAFMAYGFARASDGPGVVTATEGPGITNLVTGIAAAFKGYVPVIGMNGTQENWIRERDALQDVDQVTFFRPITKWAHTVTSASKIQEAARKAFRVALSEPRGPVHLEASREILLQETESEPLEPDAYRVVTIPDCPPASLDRAWAILAEAERPVLLAGPGVAAEGARDLLIALAEQTGAPVASLHSSPDGFPTNHPLALGPMGRNGWSSANETLPRADAVVVVGGRLDYSSSLFRHGLISRAAKLIHHATTPDAIGVVFPVALGVVGSTTSFARGLLDRAARAGRRWRWVDVAEARAAWNEERQAAINPTARPIQPPLVARLLRETLPRDGLVVIDAGNAGKHVRTYYDTDEPVSFMYTDDWGAVGSGLPIAMGAKLARPDRPVACLVGDMGVMCNLGELETAVRERIPVVCVVCNDQGLGNERAWQKELYGGRLYAVDYQNPDFAALARVFGAHGEQIHDPAELPAALRRAFGAGRPALLDVQVDPETLAPVSFH